MDLAEYVRCGTLAHGHVCPPLVLGVRAGFVAMSRLGVGRAVERELFAFVELGSDHYAQGFADGVQFVTACTFGKDLIFRFPHGKTGVRLVDQARGRAIRVSPRPETIARLEGTGWFRACASTGSFASACPELAELALVEFLTAPEDALFTVSPVFPLGFERPSPTFESIACDACAESVLAPYAREVNGGHLCILCEERRRTGLPLLPGGPEVIRPSSRGHEPLNSAAGLAVAFIGPGPGPRRSRSGGHAHSRQDPGLESDPRDGEQHEDQGVVHRS